ncbi:MAG TPA: alcohol dehydrogenase catalytic domain-containing protein [Nitrososphaerales archaeon]|nr:alcohol dehydrogenase catalytic domain-containing protein [Nitrososphaerales archaeon]
MSARTTLAAFVKTGGGVELRKVQLPRLEEGSVIVQMKASGVCGTDLEKLTGRGITSTVLGHEVAGIITESASSNFRIGDFVIPHHHVTCNACKLCHAGAGTMCEGFKTSNFIPGGFAEEFLVPSYNVRNGGVHKIGSDLSFEEASFAEPLACCIRGLIHAEVFSKPPSRILVVGAGPIGLLHMELIHSMLPGAKVTAVDVIPSRLEFAAKNENATSIDASKSSNGSFSEKARSLTNGSGFDLAIVATSSRDAFSESLRSIRKSGRLLLFGAPHKGATHNLDLDEFFLNEFAISSSYSTTEVELKHAIELLESGKIDVRKFITGRFSLEKIGEAMSSARLENQIKIIVSG